LNLAAKKGIATVSGVEMFVAQGVAQWEILDGKARARSAYAPRRTRGPPRRRKVSPAPLNSEMP